MGRNLGSLALEIQDGRLLAAVFVLRDVDRKAGEAGSRDALGGEVCPFVAEALRDYAGEIARRHPRRTVSFEAGAIQRLDGKATELLRMMKREPADSEKEDERAQEKTEVEVRPPNDE
jgi:hypothetical protein